LKIAITGAASGIGAAVAQKLSSAGHEVTAFDKAKPQAHVDHWIPIDLNDAASIDVALAAASGPYDVLINNAGLPPKPGCAELGASIVNTASRAGAMWRDNIEQVKALLVVDSNDALAEFVSSENVDHVRAYNLSKEAVIVYTMAQAEAMLARGFRMNSVSPAAVSTDILDDFINAFGDRVKKNLQRIGRAGNADEIADVIVFLAMPQSRWLKGVDIAVDGGMGAMAVSDALELS